MITPIHLRALIDSTERKIIYHVGRALVTEGHRNNDLSKIVTGLKGVPHRPSKNTLHFLYYGHIRHNGNHAAYTADEAMVRTAIKTVPSSQEKFYLEQIFRFYYGHSM
jgi:hypothetical protein